MSAAPSKIRYDGEKNRFLITASPFDIGVMMRLPMRRYMKKAGVWIAPATRINCTYLLEKCLIKWDWEADASEAANKAIIKIDEHRVWPAWYKHKGPEPYKHQRTARELAYAKDSYFLSMEQGTAKTKVAIDVACAHHLHNKIQYVVIVCPLSVARTWEDELITHCPLPYAVARGDSKFSGLVIKDGQIGFIIVGVESFSQGKTAEALLRWAPYNKFMMVVDESHSIKTHDSIRTVKIAEIGKHAQTRMCLTGTPITKNLIDLYAQYEFLDTNIVGVGDYYAYRNRYAVMGGYKRKQIIGYDNVDELMGFLQPYTYSITKAECLDLPPKVYTTRYVDMGKEQRAQYDLLKKNALVPYELPNVLVKMLRCRQLVGGFLPGGDGKPEMRVAAKDNTKLQALLAEIEIAPGPCIIYCEWLPEVEMVRQHLPASDTVVFTGASTPDERQEMIHQFQQGEKRYFLASTPSAHVGITLTRAETVMYYSHSNAYVIRSQSEDRPHRAGLKHTITYIDFVTNRTVDETLIAAHKNKQDLADFVRDQMQQGRKDFV